MSGGGSKSSKSTQGTETYANAPVVTTLQPTLPGLQNSLAAQLQAGFGSALNGSDLSSMLSSLYQPMTVYSFKEPISATAAAYDKSKYAPISTGNTALDALLMGKGKVDTGK